MFKSFPLRIFLVALVLRLIPVLLSRGLGIGLDDMFQYDMLARSLVSGNGYRWYAYEDLKMLEPYVQFELAGADYDPQRGVLTSFRPPLYPFFLAAIYLFSGVGAGRFFVVRIVQAVLVALLAPLTYYTARKVFGQSTNAEDRHSDSIPVLSAWAVAIYPMLVVFPLALATENLFTVLVLASFLMLLVTWEKPSARNFATSGILLGLAVLTRSVVLVFCGLVVVWLWFTLKEQRRNIALMLLSMTFIILPWVVRNSLLNQRLSGIETSLGYQLYVGYHPESTGTFKFGISLDLIPILDDSVRDRIGTEKALEFIRQDPSRFVPLMLNRLGYFFGLERRALQYFYSNNIFGFIPLPVLLAISAVVLLPFVFLSISGVLGLVMTRWSPQLTLLTLLVIGYILPHLFIISEERFHLTLVPVIAILAARFWAGGLAEFSLLWRRSRTGKLLAAFAVFGVLLLLFNWGLELTRDWDKIAQLLGPTGNKTYFPY